ncbi:MAG: hypothetical protein VXZ82_25580 [Planctomycetota bacterium]|nr:hypothetical protein [Planctomycetota bacterium]
MDFNRNRYFMFGCLLLLLGMQFRMVHSFVLNETGTNAIAKIATEAQLASADSSPDMVMDKSADSKSRIIQPPHWLGWILLTVGGVIFLHALILPPPNKS